MAKGLVGAALASGFGQGMANAAQQGMSYMTTSMLLKEREEMEQRRLQLMEGYATGRENRGYAHAEQMQKNSQGFQRGTRQEEFGMGQAAADLAVSRQEAANERAREKALDPSRIAQEAKADEARYDAGDSLREKQRQEEISSEIDKTTALGGNKTYTSAIAALTNAEESSSQKADAALKIYQLKMTKEGQQYQDDYVEAVKSGDPGRIAKAKSAWEAFAEKPWEMDKVHGQLAAQGLREAGNEIVRLQAMMKDALPGSPQAMAIERRLANAEAERSAYSAVLKRSLHSPDTSPAGPGTKQAFVNPFPDAPENGADKPLNDINKPLVAAKEAVAKRKEETRQSLQAAMNSGQLQESAPSVTIPSDNELPPMEYHRTTGLRSGRDLLRPPVKKPKEKEVVANLPRELPRATSQTFVTAKQQGPGLVAGAMEASRLENVIPETPAQAILDRMRQDMAVRVQALAPKPQPVPTRQADAAIPQQAHAKAETAQAAPPARQAPADLYQGEDQAFMKKNMKPADVFNSTEFESLTLRKQQDLQMVYQKYLSGALNRDVLTSSVHAIVGDSWGMIRAELAARALGGSQRSN